MPTPPNLSALATRIWPKMRKASDPPPVPPPRSPSSSPAPTGLRADIKTGKLFYAPQPSRRA